VQPKTRRGGGRGQRLVLERKRKERRSGRCAFVGRKKGRKSPATAFFRPHTRGGGKKKKKKEVGGTGE